MARRGGAQGRLFPRPVIDASPCLSSEHSATGQRDQVQHGTSASDIPVAVVDLTLRTGASTSLNTNWMVLKTLGCVVPTRKYFNAVGHLLTHGKTTAFEVGLCLALEHRHSRHFDQRFYNNQENSQIEARSG